MSFPSVVRSFSLKLLIGPSFSLTHFSFIDALQGSLYLTSCTFFLPKSSVSPYIHYPHSFSLQILTSPYKALLPFLSTGPEDTQSVHHLQSSFKTESLNRPLRLTIPIFITEALCKPLFFITHNIFHQSPLQVPYFHCPPLLIAEDINP